jgi:hypothetical protein
MSRFSLVIASPMREREEDNHADNFGRRSISHRRSSMKKRIRKLRASIDSESCHNAYTPSSHSHDPIFHTFARTTMHCAKKE